MYHVDLRVFSAVTRPLEVRQQHRQSPTLPNGNYGNTSDVFDNTLGGVAVPYASQTTHQGQRELVSHGAFARVLANTKHDVRLYTDHRYSVDSLLASRKSGSLTIVDTPTGLEFEARLPNTERGKHLVDLAEQGAVGASIGFRTRTSKQKTVDGVRHWIDVDLAEISIVTDPAYAGATVEKRHEVILDDWLNLFIIRQQHSRS